MPLQPAEALLLLGAGVNGLGFVQAAQQEQPQLDRKPVGEGCSHQGAAGHVVAGCAADAQNSGQGQEAGVPENSACAPVGVHLHTFHMHQGVELQRDTIGIAG